MQRYVLVASWDVLWICIPVAISKIAKDFFHQSKLPVYMNIKQKRLCCSQKFRKMLFLLTNIILLASDTECSAISRAQNVVFGRTF